MARAAGGSVLTELTDPLAELTPELLLESPCFAGDSLAAGESGPSPSSNLTQPPPPRGDPNSVLTGISSDMLHQIPIDRKKNNHLPQINTVVETIGVLGTFPNVSNIHTWLNVESGN